MAGNKKGVHHMMHALLRYTLYICIIKITQNLELELEAEQMGCCSPHSTPCLPGSRSLEYATKEDQNLQGY